MQALLFADLLLGVGLGHLSRSEALKAELETLGFKATLLDSALLDSTLKNSQSYDFIAIDSYILPLDSYLLASKRAKICLYFDDTLRLPYPKGILLNNAPSVDILAYQRTYPNHILFLGDSYTLIRSAFRFQTTPPLNPTLKNCLITLGGEDILHLNSPLIQALSHSFPALKLHCIAKDSRNLPKCVAIYSQLSAQEMAQCIRSMDICICACGQSLRETLSCGIPTIALEIASNQNANLKSFQACTLNLPKAYLLHTKEICQKVVDFVGYYENLTMRKSHQMLASKLLNHKNAWKESLMALFTYHSSKI